MVKGNLPGKTPEGLAANTPTSGLERMKTDTTGKRSTELSWIQRAPGLRVMPLSLASAVRLNGGAGENGDTRPTRAPNERRIIPRRPRPVLESETFHPSDAPKVDFPLGDE